MKPIPYGRQDIDKKDIEAVVEVLKSDFLTQGPKVFEFEKKFAEYIGVNYAVSVSNATAGLHLAVMSLDLKKGDRVITTPISFAATSNCVRYCGGEVWFADINLDNYCLCEKSVEELINSKPKGFFKGIIPVDFAGFPVNMENFKKIADKHDLWLIEDAAHAPGAYFIDSGQNKQNSGNCSFSDLAVFSFHPVKHIACGEGGMITTNSKNLYEKLKMLRTHGIIKNDSAIKNGGWYYEMQALGYNYRLTDIQSALGITQLAKNSIGVQKRNLIAKKYINSFISKIKFQLCSDTHYNAYHLFVIEVDDRKEMYDYLRKHGIYAQIHYIPIHTFPYYKKIGYLDADLSNSENFYKRCISLPMYPSLKSIEQEFIIKKINEKI
tara:strand:- start:8431 stop:9570 length:1140 start_codon:yes stop_codon:yes gene_type:complete